MPNTPCIVGEGMTAIAAARTPRRTIWRGPADLRMRRTLHADGRDALQRDHRPQRQRPAYYYLIMEAMADAGVRVGLPRDLALTSSTQTALGSARMVQTGDRHPAALRDDVTTPAGCTIGGLLMLEDGKIRSVLARAIEEATRIATGEPGGGTKKTKNEERRTKERKTKNQEQVRRNGLPSSSFQFA